MTQLFPSAEATGAGIPPKGVRVSKTSNQIGFADTTAVVVDWDQEDIDDDNFWSIGNSDRLIMPETGWYAYHGSIETNTFNIGDERLDLFVRLNGTTTIAITRQIVGTLASSRVLCAVSGYSYLTGSDYIQLVFQQFTGGSLSVENTTATYFTAIKL